MTVFRFTETDRNPAHVRANLYCGPDEDHLALAGTLTFRVDEWLAFADAITDYNERHEGHAGFEAREEWGIQHYDGPIEAVAVRPARIVSPNIHLWRREVHTYADSAVWTGSWSRVEREAEVAR